MSFDEWAVNNQNFKALSQSLWNRAMSFDDSIKGLVGLGSVSIPLEQGNVFRQTKNSSWYSVQVSIPLEQGNVFRQND